MGQRIDTCRRDHFLAPPFLVFLTVLTGLLHIGPCTSYSVTSYRTACFGSYHCINPSPSCLRVTLGCPWSDMELDLDPSSATFHQIKKYSSDNRCAESDEVCDYTVDKSSINYNVTSAASDTATCTGTSECVVYYDWPVAPRDQRKRCLGRQYLKINYTCHRAEPRPEHPTNSEETSTDWTSSQPDFTNLKAETSPLHTTVSMVTTGVNHNNPATNTTNTAKETSPPRRRGDADSKRKAQGQKLTTGMIVVIALVIIAIILIIVLIVVIAYCWKRRNRNNEKEGDPHPIVEYSTTPSRDEHVGVRTTQIYDVPGNNERPPHVRQPQRSRQNRDSPVYQEPDISGQAYAEVRKFPPSQPSTTFQNDSNQYQEPYQPITPGLTNNQPITPGLTNDADRLSQMYAKPFKRQREGHPKGQGQSQGHESPAYAMVEPSSLPPEDDDDMILVDNDVYCPGIK